MSLSRVKTRDYPKRKPYREYVALLTQTGSNPPVATVLQNELGSDLIYSYFTTGTYTVTSNGLFIPNKTVVLISSPPDSGFVPFSSNAVAIVNTSSQIDIGVTDALITPSDNLLNNTAFIIRIYS
jgi:hypothetical protein